MWVLIAAVVKRWLSEQKEKSGLFTGALARKRCQWWRTPFVRDCRLGQVRRWAGGLEVDR